MSIVAVIFLCFLVFSGVLVWAGTSIECYEGADFIFSIAWIVGSITVVLGIVLALNSIIQ